MMATCAPPNQDQDTPFNSRWSGDDPELKTWDLSKGDLARLLDLSSKLELGGEITPVMAWKMVTMDPRVVTLNQADFEELSERLMQRVRCYGYVPSPIVHLCFFWYTNHTYRFGAVMEAWEVQDVMDNVAAHRSDAMVF